MRIASTAEPFTPAHQLTGAMARQARHTVRAAVPQDSSTTAQTATGLQQLRRALCQAAGGAAETALARQALAKMEQGYKALSRTTGLDSAVALVMAQLSRQSADQISSAKSKVRSHFKTLEQKALRKVRLITEQLKAEKSAGFWSKIVSLCKWVAAGLSAASSVVTGPVGCVAAGLLIASLAVGAAWPDNEAARWISLGLGLGAAAIGGAASFVEAAGAAAAKTAAKVLQASSACASLLGSGAGVAQAAYASEGMQKQSALLAVRAQCQELLAQAEEERDLLERLLEYQGRGLDLVMKTLNTIDQNARAAANSFAPGR